MATFTKKYFYRGTVFNNGVSAQTVGESFDIIKASGKELDGETFLEYSRSEDSPTHNMFEWDDSKAAELYRIDQANGIIRSIGYTIVKEEDEVKEIAIKEVEEELNNDGFTGSKYAYVNVNGLGVGKKARYETMETVMRNDDMRQQVIQNVLSTLISYKRKYGYIRELKKVFDSIDSVAEKYGMYTGK